MALLLKCLQRISVWYYIHNTARISCNASFSTQKKQPQKNKRYSNTVLLPRTKFPICLQGEKRNITDKTILEKCGFQTLYQWQRENINGCEFVLHDGPPYANGEPHMGHAINKILKDITIRQKLLQGYKVQYITGWDCHGLPIELKALKNEETSGSKLSSIDIRNKARKFAQGAIAHQREVFESWGILTDWSNSYFTYDKDYIKNEFWKFYEMYEKGIIFRELKPVFWSPSSRTALAEAELEYNPSHHSTAIFVRLQLKKVPDAIQSNVGNSKDSPLYAVIWTTTPWTLPSNQGICYNPKLHYSVISSEDLMEKYIVASDLVETLQNKFGRQMKILVTFPGDCLLDASYRHPLIPDKTLPFLPADHVTTAKGTGLVHTSPAHGPEDFVVALKNNLPVECIVDENGLYTCEAEPVLQGLSVLSDGNSKVLDLLSNAILHRENYIHSYPYDWRTKQPVILRASQQWFININAIKDKALECIKNIDVFPKNSNAIHMGQGLSGQIEKRPYWCISRQRVWGVPIPVLFHKSDGRVLLDRALIKQICHMLDLHGTDFWWTLPVKEMVSEDWLEKQGVTANDLEKGKDIFDIWFDSGLSWSSVLGDSHVADMYLEGFDQFNGWFQSSLMTSVALRNIAPYKAIFVHGFAVDEFEKKMSKSVGNVVDPQDIIYGKNDSKEMPSYGIDTLRWWVAAHSTHHSKVPVSQRVLQDSADTLQKIRLVLRFILGSLNDLGQENIVNEVDTKSDSFYIVDQYMLHTLWDLHLQAEKLYSEFQYNTLCATIVNYVVNDVSAFYCSLIKDRLYCEEQNDRCRRACQVVLYHILETLVRLIAPITPILAEEVYLYHPIVKEGQFLFCSGPVKPSRYWEQPNIVSAMSSALSLRKLVMKQAPVTNTFQCEARINVSPSMLNTVQKFQNDNHSFVSQLCEILQVSSVVMLPESQETDDFSLEIVPSPYHSCERCRHFSSKVAGDLCERCQKVLKSLSV